MSLNDLIIEPIQKNTLERSSFVESNGIVHRRVRDGDDNIVALMTPFLQNITYNEIRKADFTDYFNYDIYNDDVLVTTLKVTRDEPLWIVKEVTEFLLGTLITDEALTQENGDGILLE